MMPTTFKLLLQMKAIETDQVVCFKQDGQRFEQAHTIKMNVGTQYQLAFILRPATHVDKLMINGEIHKFEVVKGKMDEHEDERKYVAMFSSHGYDLSKSGKRKELLIVLELDNGVYMKISLQLKLYKAGETTHCQWGNKLSAVEYECQIDSGHNYVKVLKEKFVG